MNHNASKKIDTFNYIVAGLIATIIIFSFPESTSRTVADVLVAVQPSVTRQDQQEVVQKKKDYFASTTLQAHSAYVFDIQKQQVLFRKNDQYAMPLASLTKIMTAITALDIASGLSASSTEIVISAEDLQQDGDTGLLSYEQWDLQNLLKYTLVASSNDGAAAIARSMGGYIGTSSIERTPTNDRDLFIESMNVKAAQMGLTHASFSSESGLDISTSTAGAYGSAQEVAKMLEYGTKTYPDTFGATRLPFYKTTSSSGFAHHVQNTNISISHIPRLISGKTGYTDLAGGNLAVMFNAGTEAQPHFISVVVLGSDYSSRFTDVEALVDATVLTLSQR